MTVAWATLADFVSNTDSKLNVMGMFGQINAPSLPVTIPTMYLVVWFEGDTDEIGKSYKLALRVLKEDGSVLMPIPEQVAVVQSVDPQLGDPSWANVFCMLGTTFENPGTHRFVIVVDGEEKRAVTLRVNPPPEGKDDAGSN